MPKIKKYFNEELLKKIHSLIKDGTFDVFQRSDILSSWLRPYGFKESGCGTNRIAYKKDGYIFKIAINRKGITGNHSEYELSDQLQPYVTKCYDNNGLVSMAEKVTVMDQGDMRYFEDKVYKILRKLSRIYVLSDIGPKSFLNWGINNEGDPIILDYAYIRPITSNMDFICHKKGCEGKLRYKDDFSAFECDICGREHPIVDVAGDNLDKGQYNVFGINTDMGDTYNDLKHEEQVDNVSIPSDKDKGENDMENKNTTTTIGEIFQDKIRKGDASATEACKHNSSLNSAMQKTKKIIVKENLNKYRKLADY